MTSRRTLPARYAIAGAALVLALTLGGCGTSAAVPAPTPTVQAVTVPDVVGMTGDEARDLLTDAGFTVSWGDELVLMPSNWIVNAQDPDSTGSAAPGSEIILTVSKTTDEAEAEGSSDEEQSAALEAAIRESSGGQEYSDVFAQDPSLWYGWISGVRVESGNGYITLQVSPDDPGRDELGQRAASALSALLPADAVQGISLIIVEDAGGTVIAQEQLRPVS
ncbi:PASTA domain-containing protein [Microbacterium aurantiacum]|uniref:PASTA domain-containing protein n=1 Tax=Microbacterium aurantiacum TaxID=162393 RepID=UPI0034306E9F